jgi:hypothetical protein
MPISSFLAFMLSMSMVRTDQHEMPSSLTCADRGAMPADERALIAANGVINSTLLRSLQGLCAAPLDQIHAGG